MTTQDTIVLSRLLTEVETRFCILLENNPELPDPRDVDRMFLATGSGGGHFILGYEHEGEQWGFNMAKYLTMPLRELEEVRL